MTQINVCVANKQMHDKHKDQMRRELYAALHSSLFLKQGDQNAKRTEETHRQRAGQDQNEALRSVNYRATQNKNNIGTTRLIKLLGCADLGTLRFVGFVARRFIRVGCLILPKTDLFVL